MVGLVLVLCIFVNIVYGGCNNVMDCSLGGQCIDGGCVCDPTWNGDYCDILNLLPAKNYKAYYQENESSWGGTPIFDPNTNKYHVC